MHRQLNRVRLEATMAAKGYTQTSTAAALGITKAAVSKWLTGKSFPRPPELLKLGKFLGLSYKELVTNEAATGEPLVAFRKRASTKTTSDHVEHAREMGRLLAPVVSHLAFDQYLSPSRLKNPSLDYDYLQGLVAELRKELRLDPIGPLKFESLIGKFKDLQAVLVPVMWGQKQRHENALHIYLPDSKTTWIYLNLDSFLYDFKFWIAHELGHVLSVDLLEANEIERAEDFCDAFAGALLFPEGAATLTYEKYARAQSTEARLKIIIDAAEAYVISPYTVAFQVERYAKARTTVPFEKIPDATLFSKLAEFNRKHSTVSATLFKGERPSADHFMRVCGEVFQTPIFAALGSYLKETPRGEALLSRVLDISLADAKAMRGALI